MGGIKARNGAGKAAAGPALRTRYSSRPPSARVARRARAARRTLGGAGATARAGRGGAEPAACGGMRRPALIGQAPSPPEQPLAGR